MEVLNFQASGRHRLHFDAMLLNELRTGGMLSMRKLQPELFESNLSVAQCDRPGVRHKLAAKRKRSFFHHNVHAGCDSCSRSPSSPPPHHHLHRGVAGSCRGSLTTT